MGLAQGVDQHERAVILDVPEGPAVARWRALEGGADLVNRALVAAAFDRAVGAHPRRPAPRQRLRRARGPEAVNVIARSEATKHSIGDVLDCFAALAMTAQ